MFDPKFFKDYCNKVEPLLSNLLSAKRKSFVHEPTFFEEADPDFINRLQVAFYVRQSHQKEGYIAQILLGNWPGWVDINETGVPKKEKVNFKIKTNLKQPDIWKVDNSGFIELKNRHNTVKKSDIKKTVYEPLSQYKIANPDTTVIYGIVNPKPRTTKLTNIILYNNVPIRKLEGIDLFNYVCVHNCYNYTSDVIAFAKSVIRKKKDYTQ